MAALALSRPVAVVGTGTMGQGIAQVAVAAGHPVRLYDAAPGRAREAVDGVAARLGRLVEKGRLTAGERDAAVGRLTAVGDLSGLADCGLVVEAVLEDAPVKRDLFAALEKHVADDCLLATNTSSLSVTEIAGALRVPGRFVGLHFFNPAPLMPLVEVVSGFATDPGAADLAHATALAWGKTPVRCSDTPGFVVNRVARPFYAEALRVTEERVADPATVDAVLRESGGFRMGPFELTDLIGQDVNEAVTRSVWEAFFHDPKFTPSLVQHRLVQAGRLGRKSGQGWFPYGPGAAKPSPRTEAPCRAPAEITVTGDLGPASALPGLLREAGVAVRAADPAAGQAAGQHTDGAGPGSDGYAGAGEDGWSADDAPWGWIGLPGGTRLLPVDGMSSEARGGPSIAFDLALDYRACTRVALAPSATADEADVSAAVGLFQKAGKEVSVIGDAPGMIVARTVVQLVDFALDAAARGVATEEDIDTAMKLGVNYPAGPGEWARRLGGAWVFAVLDQLNTEYPGGRYAPSRALSRYAAASGTGR
ncbi:3-hydroxyacyl-CoA dehydrogenase [Streptomyces fuscigenes]|uniref:3-hydroxyacyl-CoA dehydrogenase n=1 Tax=Streptomyces fuscigenes TaxID=1528880 RepID=UPI001F2E41EF|nr:3-hydroxyacyl-CoA dehydrogenase [Streptomyces fuscigenes]MCF3963449.1 3-hydroxyacyl-CoA dehydrogenase [Streptomyces fuscigenes]